MREWRGAGAGRWGVERRARTGAAGCWGAEGVEPQFRLMYIVSIHTATVLPRTAGVEAPSSSRPTNAAPATNVATVPCSINLSLPSKSPQPLALGLGECGKGRGSAKDTPLRWMHTA